MIPVKKKPNRGLRLTLKAIDIATNPNSPWSSLIYFPTKIFIKKNKNPILTVDEKIQLHILYKYLISNKYIKTNQTY